MRHAICLIDMILKWFPTPTATVAVHPHNSRSHTHVIIEYGSNDFQNDLLIPILDALCTAHTAHIQYQNCFFFPIDAGSVSFIHQLFIIICVLWERVLEFAHNVHKNSMHQKCRAHCDGNDSYGAIIKSADRHKHWQTLAIRWRPENLRFDFYCNINYSKNRMHKIYSK